MSRVRVLVVAPRVPWPLTSGSSLRMHHFLRCLSEEMTVTVATLTSPAADARVPPGVRLEPLPTVCSSRCAAEMTRRRPWVAQRFGRHFWWSAAAARWLQENATRRRFDVALLCGPVTGQYIDALSVPAVWDAVDDLVLYTARDVAWRAPRRWPALARAMVLYAAYERHVARSAVTTVFASSVDTLYARRWMGAVRIETISNGVDCDYFRPEGPPPPAGPILFCGSLSFPPNVDAVLQFTAHVWPGLRARVPSARLMIVGREPTESVRRLVRLPGVEVQADVPDVRPYLECAGAVVVPTRMGGGVKNRVLEACAMARPVVASPLALGGLGVRRGVEVLCATRPEAWVRQLHTLVMRSDYAAEVGRRGREWVVTAHRWPTLAAQLARVLHAAACSERDGAGASCRAPLACANHRASYRGPAVQTPVTRASSREREIECVCP